MNADKRGQDQDCLFAFICVHLRPFVFFTGARGRGSGHGKKSELRSDAQGGALCHFENNGCLTLLAFRQLMKPLLLVWMAALGKEKMLGGVRYGAGDTPSDDETAEH